MSHNQCSDISPSGGMSHSQGRPALSQRKRTLCKGQDIFELFHFVLIVQRLLCLAKDFKGILGFGMLALIRMHQQRCFPVCLFDIIHSRIKLEVELLKGIQLECSEDSVHFIFPICLFDTLEELLQTGKRI